MKWNFFKSSSFIKWNFYSFEAKNLKIYQSSFYTMIYGLEPSYTQRYKHR